MSGRIDVRRKLSKYIIDKSNKKWKAKKLTPSGRLVEIPDTLNGYILIEEVKDEHGHILGWITIHPDELAEIISKRDNPSLREDVEVLHPKYKGKKLRELTKEEYEEATGWKRHFDRWRKEGIDI